MSLRLTRLAVALLATIACATGAQAQSSYSCANDSAQSVPSGDELGDDAARLGADQRDHGR